MFNKLIPLLQKIPALDQLTDMEMRSLLNNVEGNIIHYSEKQIIIRENEINNNLHIILEGGVGLFVTNMASKCETSVGELHSGGIIGETDLYNEVPQEYTGTIRALDDSTLLFKIDRMLLLNYLKKSNTQKQRTLINQQADTDEDKTLLNDITYKKSNGKSLVSPGPDNAKEIINTLKKTGLFNKASQQELSTIEDRVEIINAHEGNIILKEGTPGDCLYVIMSGSFDVFTKNNKNNMCILAHLKPGDYFGEHALLDGDEGKRNASVMAVAPSKLIKVPTILFRKILRRDHELHMELSKKRVIQLIQNEQLLEGT